MRIRRFCHFAGIFLSLLAAGLPLLRFPADNAGPMLFIASLNCLGWLLVAFFLWKRITLERSYLVALAGRKTDAKVRNLEDEISDYLLRTAQLFRVGYSRSLDDFQNPEMDLSRSLRGIAEIAYQELDARCVELSLYDQESDTWNQAFLLGIPHSPGISKEIRLAGTIFGRLRVELPDEAPLAASEELLSLLAVQGALMMVNSRFTEELLRLKQKSEESVRAKTGFLANLSHEIRGPLGTILNAVEISLEGLCGEMSEEQKEILGMIKKSGEHLLDLVNDVLDYAKVEAGKVSVTPVQLALKPLLDDLTKVVRSQAHVKGHTVTLKDVPEEWGVVCDKRHFRQMVINMLTNAIKYTKEKGEITVWVERLGGNKVKVCVQDTGIGIQESEREKVFGAFERVNDKYALAQLGTGLGMPLTRRLAELNGGLADFSSKYGQGSTFWVVLPGVEIEVADEDEEEASSLGKKVQNGRGETILLVDNDESARNVLEKYLVDQGFSVAKAGSGAQVLQALRDHKISLMVVENELPDLQGAELVSAIRSNPRAQTLPIILLSSRAFVFDIEHYLKLGVDRCLSKPVELKVLAKTARQLIDESSRTV